MCANWVGPFNPGLLIDRLNSGRKITKQGKVQYTSEDFVAFFDMDSVLTSAISLDASIRETDKRRIVLSAKYAGNKPKLSPKDYLRIVANNERKFLRARALPYVVLTSFSAPRYQVTVRHASSTITIGRPIPPRFAKVRAAHADEVRQWLHADLPKRYTSVRISTRGRSVHEAMEVALDRFDEWRGIWNLSLNRGGGIRFSSGPHRPVNAVVIGPFHTLHTPNGGAAHKHPWYEPQYAGAINPPHIGQDKFKAVLRYQDQFRGLLRTSHYKGWLRDGLRQYTRALDSADWHTSFIKLWAVLEYLSVTARQRYDVTIKRAAFVWKDYEFHRIILEHLRQQRNRAAHVGTESGDRETHLYQLKRYVDQLLVFHFGWSQKLQSERETAEFLDLPANAKILRAAYKFFEGK